MSLVNDALKRAKEAQDKQNQRPLAGAPLHTPAPARGSKLWVFALLAFILAIAVAGGGIWYLKQNGQISVAGADKKLSGIFSTVAGWFHRTQAEPEKKSSPIVIIGNVTNPLDHIAAQKPAPKPAAENPPTPTVEPPKPAPAVEAKTETTPGAIVVDNRKPLNLLPQVAPEKPATPVQPPQALKLQGILYSATHPAAILNGRTVFVGDHFSEMTVTEISANQITITYSNQPIVLKLP